MSKAVVPRLRMVNNVTFPRELRDAIPDHNPSAGRCLKLDSIDAEGWRGRVQLKLHVCETGKLSGAFDVRIDVETEAARALADLIQRAIAQSEAPPTSRTQT